MHVSTLLYFGNLRPGLFAPTETATFALVEARRRDLLPWDELAAPDVSQTARGAPGQCLADGVVFLPYYQRTASTAPPASQTLP